MKKYGGILIVLLVVVIAGCIKMGGATKVEEADYQSLPYDRAFSAAIRAMNDVGKVTNSDKEAGYVNGTSNGVDLVVTIDKVDKGVKLTVKGTLQPDMINIKVHGVDEFLDAYKKYAH